MTTQFTRNVIACLIISTITGWCGIKAQETKFIACKPNNLQAEAPATSSDAKYSLPAPLRNYGAIDFKTNPAVCNLLFYNPKINGVRGTYLLASGQSPVVYKDESTGNPTEWHWTVPGYPKEITTQDASVLYATPGVYDMPTLEVKTANGTSSYNSGYKIKVGGNAEISTIDCREWASTYLLGSMPYEPGEGYMGGTNRKDIAGYGNLFMIGTDEARMTGVNVYLPFKPTKFKEGASLRLQVWIPTFYENDVVLTGTPVDGMILPMKDILDESNSDVWVPVENGAVAQFKFSDPIDMFGKPIFFISIEGFSNDPETEDFCLLTDFIGKVLGEDQLYKRLAHNSFARMKNESDYLRPIFSYGGGFGSFAICPVLSLPDVGTGIETTTTDKTGNLKARFNEDGSLEVTSAAPCTLKVTDIAGKTVYSGNINEGNTRINMPSLSKGIYIVSGSKGNSVKVMR